MNTSHTDFKEKLDAFTSNAGPDVVIEAVGSPATYRLAVDVVAFSGRVVCIGYSKNEVTFQTALFVKKELDIRGSRNATPADFEAVKKYLEHSGCPVDKLVSSIVSMDEAEEALKDWDEKPGRVFRILLKL